jgi:hypothetical protein
MSISKGSVIRLTSFATNNRDGTQKGWSANPLGKDGTPKPISIEEKSVFNAILLNREPLLVEDKDKAALLDMSIITEMALLGWFSMDDIPDHMEHFIGPVGEAFKQTLRKFHEQGITIESLLEQIQASEEAHEEEKERVREKLGFGPSH